MQVKLKLFVAQFLGLVVIFALALFVPAGTITWPAGWIFLVMFFTFFIAVNVWLLEHNPGLVQERMHFGTADQQGVSIVDSDGQDAESHVDDSNRTFRERLFLRHFYISKFGIVPKIQAQ